MTASEYWFRGIVSESADGRPSDGPFIVTVEVTEPLGQAQFAAGTSFQVVVQYGFSPRRCLGEGTEGTPVGAEVIVYAHDDQDTPGHLAICQDDRYYMRVEAREDAVKPPPYPTCSADGDSPQPIVIECGVQLRTVTIDLWSCDGGPCEGPEEVNCQRSLLLQIGNESWEPEPFFCHVQFHKVPVGDYLVSVVRRVACGPACDALEWCQVVASANRIAIVPVAEGECPVHVIN